MSASAVSLAELEPGIVQMTMQDKASKNLFSETLIQGLIDAFAQISQMPHCKVLILTGYGNYFCSGGTREGLQMLAKGRAKFTDANIYSLALDCPVPVISAMQGHAIGGGLAMGLFADFVVFSKESIYTSNFMKYGFTPGMGATLILPKKLGFALAQEMLMTANTYFGEELQKRAIPFPVVGRGEFSDYVLNLARNLAAKPRKSLVVLKKHMVSDIKTELKDVIKRELLMHEQTFYQNDVRDNINMLF